MLIFKLYQNNAKGTKCPGGHTSSVNSFPAPPCSGSDISDLLVHDIEKKWFQRY
jgi:hypothetical protein